MATLFPDKDGRIKESKLKPVSALQAGDYGIICGVANHSAVFLQHLEKLTLTLGKQIRVIGINVYDNSVALELEQTKLNISREVAKNLLIG